MLHCEKCGAQLQRPGADCVTCLRQRMKARSNAAFVPDDDDDDEDEFVAVGDFDAEDAYLDDTTPLGTVPSTERAKRWYDELDQSPVFKYAAPEADPDDPDAEEQVPESIEQPVAASSDEELEAEPFHEPEPVNDVVRSAAEHAAIHPAVEPISDEISHVAAHLAEPRLAEPETTPIVEPITGDLTGEVTATRPVQFPTAQPVASPVVQPMQTTGMAVVTPMTEPAEGVEVAINPRYEFHSAPGEASPAVHVLLDMTPVGRPLVDADDGPIAHVILALDLSASMNHARKYPVLTRALENMLNDLRYAEEGDVLISLVVYAYGAEILLKAAPASEIDPRHVLSLIDNSKLRFGRYTDIVGALSRGGRIALDSHRAMPRVPIRMYVLTDGQPQDMAGAQKTMEMIRKLPVDVHGLAFGDDADVDALQALISGGRGGTIKHVRPDTLNSAFERIGEVARRVVAKRSLLEVELRDGIVGGAAYRFRPGRHAYGTTAFKSGRVFKTDLGTLESGRSYSLLLQLRLPPTEDSSTELGRVTLRIPGEGGPVTFEALLSIDRHAGERIPDADPAVTEVRDVVEAVGAVDPVKQLRALHARRKLYTEERRDPYIIELIEKAIEEMESKGTLSSLSDGERAALQSHTQSVVGGSQPAKAGV